MALFKRSGYWQDVNPAGAIGDIITVFRQADHNRWRIAIAAAIVTTGIFSVMWQEGAKGPPKPPEVTYIRTFADNRSDAEIIASNRANQLQQNALNAEQAKRDAEVRKIYKTIGRASGMDVDAIERQANGDDAAAARAQKAAIAGQLAAQRAAQGAAQGAAQTKSAR